MCNRLLDPAYCPILLALALPLYILDIVKITYRLRSSGSTFTYLYHLISLDLQLSRLFNTYTAKLIDGMDNIVVTQYLTDAITATKEF